MLTYSKRTTTITCDKCGSSQTEKDGDHNEKFWQAGWGLYPRAKKYEHKCYSCQPKKHRDAHDSIASKISF